MEVMTFYPPTESDNDFRSIDISQQKVTPDSDGQEVWELIKASKILRYPIITILEYLFMIVIN